ncbi:hypothetical protein EYF80_021219 [Liparis tanakae]|uniref:Uncharacterized protein n=1 Tax=Liparis tanakae TaxID=230148 RepID=A0A4Z2HUD7_9TELE|nr:hypothetical protein EYF80_021219 [Liparis tanakae]
MSHRASDPRAPDDTRTCQDLVNKTLVQSGKQGRRAAATELIAHSLNKLAETRTEQQRTPEMMRSIQMNWAGAPGVVVRRDSDDERSNSRADWPELRDDRLKVEIFQLGAKIVTHIAFGVKAPLGVPRPPSWLHGLNVLFEPQRVETAEGFLLFPPTTTTTPTPRITSRSHQANTQPSAGRRDSLD